MTSTMSGGSRLARERVRKLIHMGMVVLPAWIAWAPPAWRLRGLVLAFLLVLAADLARHVWKTWGNWIDTRSHAYQRPIERHLWVGVHAMFVSACVLTQWATAEIAITSLCYGVFGDAAAALVGLQHHADGHGKSWRGSVACFVVCATIGAALLPGQTLAIVASAVAATLLERWSGRIDDNLTIPLGSALVLSLLR